MEEEEEESEILSPTANKSAPQKSHFYAGGGLHYDDFHTPDTRTYESSQARDTPKATTYPSTALLVRTVVLEVMLRLFD